MFCIKSNRYREVKYRVTLYHCHNHNKLCELTQSQAENVKPKSTSKLSVLKQERALTFPMYSLGTSIKSFQKVLEKLKISTKNAQFLRGRKTELQSQGNHGSQRCKFETLFDTKKTKTSDLLIFTGLAWRHSDF